MLLASLSLAPAAERRYLVAGDMGLLNRNAGYASVGLVSVAIAAIFSSSCSRHESPDQLPSSTAAAASAGLPPCPVRLADVTFEACNLDLALDPLCFRFFVLAKPGRDRSGCVPGRVRLAILGSARYQTDELVVTTSLVSGDARSAVIELRLENMEGSQGFFKGTPGALVGAIHRPTAGAEYFELGPALLPSALNVRTAALSDIRY